MQVGVALTWKARDDVDDILVDHEGGGLLWEQLQAE